MGSRVGHSRDRAAACDSLAGGVGSDHNGLWLAPGSHATIDLFEVDGLVFAVVVAAPGQLFDAWSTEMAPLLESITIDGARDTSLDGIP